MVELNKYLKNKNIAFIYIQAPIVAKPNGYDLPSDFKDASNITASKSIEGFRKNNIEILDFREYLIENDMDFKSWFFKTDLHWTARAAFEANKVICERIKNDIDCCLNYDYFDLNNYNIKGYNYMLGGIASEFTGLLYAENTEIFEMITPRFKTDLSWICEEKGYYKRGEAKDSLVLYEQLHGAYYSVNFYGAYSLIHANYTVIKNHLVKNNKKVFIINDSFSNVLAMFISQQFSEVHFFDFRQNNFNEKLFKTIEEINPDIVLILYNPPHTKRLDSFDVNPNKNTKN